MFKRVRGTWKPILLVVLLVATSSPVHGQLVGRPIGDDPAYWWTLTDEVTPDQLRAELQSREKSRERLKAAIEAGLHGQVSEAQLADLSFFIEGRLTPELVPMWEAFASWAGPLDYLPGWEEQLRQYLASCEVSAGGAEQVISISYDHGLRAAQLMARLGHKAPRFFVEVVRPARERLGRSGADSALRGRDYGRLAAVSGIPAAEVEELHSAWQTDPAAETSLASIKDLREVLDKSDWNRFRACLLGTTAPDYHRDHYGPEAFQ